MLVGFHRCLPTFTYSPFCPKACQNSWCGLEPSGCSILLPPACNNTGHIGFSAIRPQDCGPFCWLPSERCQHICGVVIFSSLCLSQYYLHPRFSEMPRKSSHSLMECHRHYKVLATYLQNRPNWVTSDDTRLTSKQQIHSICTASIWYVSSIWLHLLNLRASARATKSCSLQSFLPTEGLCYCFLFGDGDFMRVSRCIFRKYLQNISLGRYDSRSCDVSQFIDQTHASQCSELTPDRLALISFLYDLLLQNKVSFTTPHGYVPPSSGLQECSFVAEIYLDNSCTSSLLWSRTYLPLSSL